LRFRPLPHPRVRGTREPLFKSAAWLRQIPFGLIEFRRPILAEAEPLGRARFQIKSSDHSVVSSFALPCVRIEPPERRTLIPAVCTFTVPVKGITAPIEGQREHFGVESKTTVAFGGN